MIASFIREGGVLRRVCSHQVHERDGIEVLQSLTPVGSQASNRSSSSFQARSTVSGGHLLVAWGSLKIDGSLREGIVGQSDRVRQS